jgi:Ca2+-binding RTX toxin-like protein
VFPIFRRTLILVSLATIFVLGPGVAQAGAPKDDWPRINGELWINSQDTDTTHGGTRKNDELLGGHGDDRIYGRGKHDVIWGDHRASGNNKRQVDTLHGGPGKDWIYASHGRNIISGGGGDDTIRVWFGRGRVDCGSGDDDILYVSKTQNRKVKRRNCERVLHRSAKDAVHDRDGLYD